MVDAHLRSKTIETADIKNLIIGGQTGIDGIRFCLAAVTNGENLADPAFSWFLQYKNKNGQGESVGLTPVYENGFVKLPWVPNKLATQVPGRMQIQLYAAIVTGEGEAAVVDKQWVSEFAIIYIQENINPDPIVATEPSVIEYYVTLYAAYKNAAEAAAAAALESEQAAALSESDAADSEAAALASKQAAGLSEQAAALAAGSALESKNSIDATFTDPGLVAVRTDMATPETSKIQKVAANEANITEVADDLNLGSSSKITKVADDIAKVGAVADGMTYVTAVEAKLTDIAKVAAIEVAVPKVAAIDTDVTKVAAIDEAVGLVAGVKDDVTAVALIDDEISAIALIKDQIVSLEAEKLKVSAVEAKLVEIHGVYAKLQAIEALYGKSTEIDALYTQLGVIAAKANQADLEALQLATARQETRANEFEKILNSTQGTTFNTTDIGTVQLPPNATGRALSNVKGLTARNGIRNGDISQGTSEWLSALSGVLSANSGILRCTFGVNRVLFGQTNIFSAAPTTDVVFISIRLRANKLGTVQIQLSDGAIGASVTISSGSLALTTEWAIFSVRLTGKNGIGSVYKHLTIDGASFNASGDWIETDGNYGVMAINLTTHFGTGNEPSLSDCQKYFSTYFSDTKSLSGPMRLLMLGKNRFDSVNIVTGAGIDASNGIFTANATGWRTGYIEVDPNTSYIISGLSTNRNFASYYDSAKRYLGRTSAQVSQICPIATPSNCHYLALTQYEYASAAAMNARVEAIRYTAQFEFGTFATTYERYKSVALYIDDVDEYRSIPSVRDEVFPKYGDYWKKQGIDRISNAGTFSDASRDSTLTKLFSIPTSIGVTTQNDQISQGIFSSIIPVVAANATYIIADNEGYSLNSVGILDVRILKSRLTAAGYSSDATGFNAWLQSLSFESFMYQLAIPVYIKLNTLGNLFSFHSVSIMPYYQHSFQSDASSHINLPYTGEIEKVFGYDEDFKEYEVPSTGYSLAGTMLTITGAEEGEVWYIMMSRGYKALEPEITINSINSQTTFPDTANGKYYKLVPTITNGALVTQTPVEVI